MKKTNYPDKRCLPKNVNVQFQWYSFDRKQQLVKESTGGGIPSKRLNRTTSFEELMDRAKSLFFHMATTIKRKVWIAMQIIWLIYAYYLADFVKMN